MDLVVQNYLEQISAVKDTKIVEYAEMVSRWLFFIQFTRLPATNSYYVFAQNRCRPKLLYPKFRPFISQSPAAF